MTVRAMPQVDRILFPVDFSEHGNRVAAEVFAMGRNFAAEVMVLHSMNLPPGSSAEWLAYLQLVDNAEVRKVAEENLDRFLAREAGSGKVSKHIVRGHPATEILAMVERENVSFIAMPTRGLGPFDSFLFGSVTERVLHRAACPVWTEGAKCEVVLEHKRILCAVDLAPASTAVAAWAAHFAQSYGAALTLLHVGHGDNALVELRHLAETLPVPAECQVVGGEITTQVLAAIEALGSDLLVIGRGEERALLGRFRSHAQTIIRQSPCAVFSV